MIRTYDNEYQANQAEEVSRCVPCPQLFLLLLLL